MIERHRNGHSLKMNVFAFLVEMLKQIIHQPRAQFLATKRRLDANHVHDGEIWHLPLENARDHRLNSVNDYRAIFFRIWMATGNDTFISSILLFLLCTLSQSS
jgi:hypothetical protein